MLFKRVDPTKDPIFKSILFLSIPMILEMVAQNIFNLVDMYFVSRIAYQAIGALVSSSLTIMLLFSVSVGISTATGMYVASLWGAKEFKKASLFFSNVILFVILFGAFLSIVFYIFLSDIVRFVGLEGLTAQYAKEYLSVASIGFIFNFVFNLNNSTLRSISLPSVVLGIMILSNLLNIVLDPLFIFYFKMGIKGAALSTIVSVIIGIAIQFFYLSKNSFYVKLKMKAKVIKKVLKKGIFASLHLLYRIGSMLVLIKFVGTISQEAISSYSVVIRIYQILLFMVFGLANTSFVIVGQNYGAKNYDRAKSGAFSVILFGILLVGGLNVLIYLFKEPILSVFVENTEVKRIAESVMFFYFISYPFVVASTIAARSSMALHDTKRPSMVNLVNLWFFMLPLAYILQKFYGLDGIWSAIAISNFTSFIANGMILIFNLKRVRDEGFVI
ncbi:MATE family efflux transporter [Hippea alviniae]|uniref:MATE family efflux transporter n=1 Tax=Hippea alviniae TaxID=1279027 RepID=UPI0003B5D406|nr:MATE family efflux transporter [Hippea alviniae]